MLINDYDIEYLDESHTYLIDGVQVPSVTQILKVKFAKKYKFVKPAVLNRAAEEGTKVHKAIEDYCKTGKDDGSDELRNFKFLQRSYGFKVLGNEIPVILFRGSKPIAAGRFDLLLEKDGQKGIADIKRTSVLDKEYLFYQLNLYRMAYIQSYGGEIDFLKGIHILPDKRKYVDIPINLDAAWEIVDEYFDIERLIERVVL